MMRKIYRILLCIIFLFCVIQSQSALNIVDYKSFPSELEILNIKPDILEWGVAGNFLLLDKVDHQLVSIGSLNDLQLVGGFGRRTISFSEPIWVGVSPNGILLVDRLDNKIISLDYRLIYMSETSLEPRIYPELAAIDKWGTVYMYSSQYHSIFSFKQGSLKKIPHIDLKRYDNIDYCLSQIIINEQGDIGVLGCDNSVHIFSRHGEYKNSYYPVVDNAEFLVPLRNDWLVFNKIGDGQSILLNKKLEIPEVSIPILDIKSMNRSVAVLSKDHILILNAQIK
ncbi:MAG: hypothetical protein CMG64_06520 [Candidatus Marinimicrobia bacterium]|nr:hypothetical protein [Candidatus Neomarinimicrobiota bacterium]